MRVHGLPETAMLDMGDFAGGMLKYLRRHPVPRLTIGGGFAKLTKLAQGNLDLHSGRSQVDFDWLATRLEVLGARVELRDQVLNANTALQVLELAMAHQLDLANDVAALARAVALGVLDGSDVAVETLVFDRAGELIGRADGW
jgi:cobalt-precorrin-5B (C1)-methyltransferase